MPSCLVPQMGANGNALRSFRTLRILRSFRVLRVLKVSRAAGGGQLVHACRSSGRQAQEVGPWCPTFRFLFPPNRQIFRYLARWRTIAEGLRSTMSQFLAVALLMVGAGGHDAALHANMHEPSMHMPLVFAHVHASLTRCNVHMLRRCSSSLCSRSLACKCLGSSRWRWGPPCPASWAFGTHSWRSFRSSRWR